VNSGWQGRFSFLDGAIAQYETLLGDISLRKVGLPLFFPTDFSLLSGEKMKKAHGT
jgi:hypothetical protein